MLRDMTKKGIPEHSESEWIQKPPPRRPASWWWQEIRRTYGPPPYRRPKAGRPEANPEADR
jgi:hypothetical protein